MVRSDAPPGTVPIICFEEDGEGQRQGRQRTHFVAMLVEGRRIFNNHRLCWGFWGPARRVGPLPVQAVAGGVCRGDPIANSTFHRLCPISILYIQNFVKKGEMLKVFTDTVYQAENIGIAVGAVEGLTETLWHMRRPPEKPMRNLQ